MAERAKSRSAYKDVDFDWTMINNALGERATNAFKKLGFAIRDTAQKSMPETPLHRGTHAPAGQPPEAHTGHKNPGHDKGIKRHLSYLPNNTGGGGIKPFNPQRIGIETQVVAIVGTIKLPSKKEPVNSTVPRVQEKGGLVRTTKKNRPSAVKYGGTRGKILFDWAKERIKAGRWDTPTGQQSEHVVNVQPRPYMRPALEAAFPRLAEWGMSAGTN